MLRLLSDASKVCRLWVVVHAPSPGRPVEVWPLGHAVQHGAWKVLRVHLLKVDHGDDPLASHGSTKRHGSSAQRKYTENKDEKI